MGDQHHNPLRCLTNYDHQLENQNQNRSEQIKPQPRNLQQRRCYEANRITKRRIIGMTRQRRTCNRVAQIETNQEPSTRQSFPSTDCIITSIQQIKNSRNLYRNFPNHLRILQDHKSFILRQATWYLWQMDLDGVEYGCDVLAGAESNCLTTRMTEVKSSEHTNGSADERDGTPSKEETG